MALHCRGVGFGRLLEGVPHPFPRRFSVQKRMTCAQKHEWLPSFLFTEWGQILVNDKALTCPCCGREGAVAEEDE